MTTKLLNDEIITQVKDVFNQLHDPVEILYFGEKENCQFCSETLQLVKEVSSISDNIELVEYDIDEDSAIASQYNLDKTPGLAILGRDGDQLLDYGIRFAGIPSGHEFSSLIQDIILVSARDSGLSQETREYLEDLTEPVLLQVFVTPTCPYCPQAVILAHKMALESPLVEAEMVEATEFPELSQKYGVSGVPQTTINAGAGNLVGALPEANLVEGIQEALDK